MANEKKGKAYEALVVAATRAVVDKSKQHGKVFWNEIPAGMTIEPDVIVGASVNTPKAVLLVTHSASEKNSNQKFWRNIGELVEAKTCLNSVPLAINIIFDGAFKPDLAQIQGATFDYEIRVFEAPFWSRLQSWIDGNAESLPTDQDEKCEAITNLAKSTTALSAALAFLIHRISAGLATSPDKAMAALWKLQRTRLKPQSRSNRTTYVRRGLGKCLVFPSILASAASWKAAKLSSEDYEVAVAIGSAQMCVGSTCRITDPEVISATQLLSYDEAVAIVARQPRDRMRVWIEPLRDLGSVAGQFIWICENWQQLSDPLQLFNLLRKCHDSPSSLGPRVGVGDARVWLYHLLIDILKTASNKKQSYGLAALLDDIKRLRDVPGHRDLVARLATTTGVHNVVWRDDRGISLGLGDWANGPSTQKFPLNADDLARVAGALSERIASTSVPSPEKSLHALVDTVVSTNLDAKLLPYRLFDPLRAHIELALERAGHRATSVSNMSACFADRVRSESSLDKRSGGTAVLQVGSTVINWQSVSDEGRDHKKKELCGRAPAIRFHWDQQRKAFGNRSGVRRLLLVLDGTWRQNDLNALSIAGWDDIFYVDEMDKLVNAVV